METYISVLTVFGMQILFLAISLATVGIIGWEIYNKILLKDISLKNELFVKDSFSAWLDFTGSFLIPILYLISSILASSGRFAHNGKWIDLIYLILHILFYIAVFSFLRYVAERLVSFMANFVIHEKVSLIKEIYNKKNISASIFSISISVIAVSLLLQENFLNESFVTNIIRLFVVLLLTIGLLGIYKDYFFPTNAKLFREIFIDNNTCTSILILGQVTAVSFIINSSISWLNITNLGWLKIGYLVDLILFVSFIYLIMLVTVSILKIVVNFIFKINIDKELFEDNNVGYSFTESSFYIILSFMIINSFLI